MRSATDLTQLWIESWSRGDPSPIPLAEGFVHVSPFGRIEGRDRYLAFMAPMVGTEMELEIVRLHGHEDEAIVHYTMPDPGGGVIDACDWITVADGEIAAIHSFYDATTLRSSGR